MSIAATEKLSLNREQVPLRREAVREIGAATCAACAVCPLMAVGCPGKQEALVPCPPEAKVIKKVIRMCVLIHPILCTFDTILFFSSKELTSNV